MLFSNSGGETATTDVKSLGHNKLGERPKGVSSSTGLLDLGMVATTAEGKFISSGFWAGASRCVCCLCQTARDGEDYAAIVVGPLTSDPSHLSTAQERWVRRRNGVHRQENLGIWRRASAHLEQAFGDARGQDGDQSQATRNKDRRARGRGATEWQRLDNGSADRFASLDADYTSHQCPSRAQQLVSSLLTDRPQHGSRRRVSSREWRDSICWIVRPQSRGATEGQVGDYFEALCCNSLAQNESGRPKVF